MTTSYLTTPNARKTQQQTYRYFVELASNELELDRNGIPVPKRYQIVDVVVLENTKAAIETAITVAGWLEGYSMVAHWLPDDSCPF